MSEAGTGHSTSGVAPVVLSRGGGFLHQLSRLLLQPRILLAAFASNNEKSILTASGFRLPLNPNKSEIKTLKKWSQLCIYPANVIGTISFLAGVSFQA